MSWKSSECLMHVQFTSCVYGGLRFLRYSLRNKDLLDTHLDLLDTDITSKNFVCLRDVLKTNKCLLGWFHCFHCWLWTNNWWACCVCIFTVAIPMTINAKPEKDIFVFTVVFRNIPKRPELQINFRILSKNMKL